MRRGRERRCHRNSVRPDRAPLRASCEQHVLADGHPRRSDEGIEGSQSPTSAAWRFPVDVAVDCSAASDDVTWKLDVLANFCRLACPSRVFALPCEPKLGPTP